MKRRPYKKQATPTLMGWDEIARRLSMTPGHVRMMHSRAIRKLRRLLRMFRGGW